MVTSATFGLLCITAVIGVWLHELMRWHENCGHKWNKQFYIGGSLWTGVCAVALILIARMTDII